MEQKPEPDDSALIHQCLKSREDLKQSFKSLYDRHTKGLFSFLMRLTGDCSTAEDILQETFERVYEQLNDRRVVDNFSSYLYATGRNIYHDMLRKKKRSQAFIESRAHEIARTSGIRDGVEEHQRILEQIICELPPMEREVFLLKRRRGFDFETIASICECSVRTAKSRMKKAVDRLFKNAREKGITE